MLSSFTPAPDDGPRRHPRRRLVVGAVLAIAAGVAIWLAVGHWRGDEPASYAVAPVTRADLAVEVTATGTLSPVVEVEVGSQVSGRIQQLDADYNTRVRAGQVIARLDPQLFETAVSQARAHLASARADLERAGALADNASLEARRSENLYARGVVASSEVDAARSAERVAAAQLAAARAAVTVARAQLDQAEVNLAYTVIHAPIDGVVVSRNVDVGQTVAASLQAPTLFVIAEDLRKMEVHTAVAESDVGQLVPGMAVEFTVDAYPDETFTGVVREVRYEPHTVSNVVTYDAVIAVANDDLRLRPGMTANVGFVLDRRTHALLVPNRALRYRPAGTTSPRGDHNARLVWVLRDGEPAAVWIDLGLTDGVHTEVLSGALAEGDQVLLGGAAAAVERRPHGPPRVL